MKLPKLIVLKHEFTIHKMSPKTRIPANLQAEEFFWISRTNEELSIMCKSSIEIISEIKDEGWTCIKVLGPLDFSEIGILSNISAVLAKAKISILAISTFDTDYIFIKSMSIKKAISVLTLGGYEVLGNSGKEQAN